MFLTDRNCYQFTLYDVFYHLTTILMVNMYTKTAIFLLKSSSHDRQRHLSFQTSVILAFLLPDSYSLAWGLAAFLLPGSLSPAWQPFSCLAAFLLPGSLSPAWQPFSCLAAFLLPGSLSLAWQPYSAWQPFSYLTAFLGFSRLIQPDSLSPAWQHFSAFFFSDTIFA